MGRSDRKQKESGSDGKANVWEWLTIVVRAVRAFALRHGQGKRVSTQMSCGALPGGRYPHQKSVRH